MPAGHNVEEKYFNDIKVDKENDVCFFNDEQHKYYNKSNMRTYVSCTTIVHEYSQPFDEDFWASYKALEAILDLKVWLPVKQTLLATKKFNPKLITKLAIDEQIFQTKKNEILAEYQRKREEACVKGTAKHLEKELSFYNRTNFDFSKYGYKDLVGEFVCKENYYNLDLQNGVYPEFLIQWESEDGELMLAGISDLVVVKGNDLYITDWKTSKSIDKKSYFNRATGKSVKMQYPLNNLDDCNYNVYSLQLSLYAWMIQQQKPELNVKGLTIVQLLDDGTEVNYACPYLKMEIEKMISHYKKQKKVKESLAKLKPVI